MRLTTPAAVLIGIVLAGLSVATAVFFALRARPLAPPATAASAPTWVPEGELPSPTVVRAPSSAVPTSGPMSDAIRALDAQRDAVVKTCFDAPKRGSTPVLAYTLHVEFDAQGHQTAKAMITPRGPGRLDVTECIARRLSALAIPREDAPAALDVPFQIP